MPTGKIPLTPRKRRCKRDVYDDRRDTVSMMLESFLLAVAQV
jgi:hypothetical protein